MSEEKALEIIEAEVKESPAIVNAGREEIDIQISTARRYPRSLEIFRKKALSMATINEDTAARCFYVLPKGGKNIEGPGVRLSEIVAVTYGNLRFGQSYIGETDDRKSVIGEGFCFDLENNVASRIQITRRITDKHNKRYSEDVVESTKLAAAAIGKRQAIFNVVPMMFVQDIYEKCKEVAIGKAHSFSEKRQKWIEYFGRFGVLPDRILSVLGKPSIDDLNIKDMEVLVGLSTAIKDGDIDIDAAFPPILKEGEKPKTLTEKVAAKAAETKQDNSELGSGRKDTNTNLSKNEAEELAASADRAARESIKELDKQLDLTGKK